MQGIILRSFVLCIFCIVWSFVVGLETKLTKEVELMKMEFQNSFDTKCGKYSFIEQLKNLNSSRHIVYQYDQHYGLGDRFAGVITTFLIALRFNRTLTIKSASKVGLYKYFRPYNLKKESSGVNYNHYDFNDNAYGPDEVHVANCQYEQNERAHNIKCVMKHEPKFNNSDDDTRTYPVIMYHNNKAHLCKSMRMERMKEIISPLMGIDSSTNLAEVAGCILRLYFWPTDRLWAEIDGIIRKMREKLYLDGVIKESSSAVESRNVINNIISLQLRCGDNGFNSSDTILRCSTNWNAKGLISCGKAMYGQYNASDTSPSVSASVSVSAIETGTSDSHVPPILYLTGDHLFTMRFIEEAIAQPMWWEQDTCHVGFNKTEECTRLALRDFFMLSQSKRLIAGAWQQQTGPQFISSFARYAALYSLKEDVLQSSGSCTIHESMHSIFSRPQGNWMCE